MKKVRVTEIIKPALVLVSPSGTILGKDSAIMGNKTNIIESTAIPPAILFNKLTLGAIKGIKAPIKQFPTYKGIVKALNTLPPYLEAKKGKLESTAFQPIKDEIPKIQNTNL